MIGCVWRVEWGNPFKDPPEGMEKVLAESVQPVGSVYWSKHPPEIEAAYPGVGKGYCVVWSALSKLPKTMAPEKLASVRRKRLERRLRKKYPLLADLMIAEEIEKKKDYYAGITDPEIEERREKLYKDQEERIKLVARRKGQGKDG